MRRDRMRRRTLLRLLCVGAAMPAAAFAQTVRTLGLVSPGLRPAQGLDSPNLQAFRDGLVDAGVDIDRSTRLEVRWAAGDLQLARRHIAEMIDAGASVLVTPSFPISQIAAGLTRTIPIVTVSSDPVGTGLVDSLSKPAGNITGLSYMTPEANPKRLELLKTAVTGLDRVAVLLNRKNGHEELGLARLRGAAQILGIELDLIEAERAEDIDGALASIGSEKPGALFPFENPLTAAHFRRMIDFANARNLPTMFELTDFVQAGALMAYGPSYRELFTRAGVIAGRLLRGDPPAAIPIEQPRTFELAINLKTAKGLGLALPQSLLVSAEVVIE